MQESDRGKFAAELAALAEIFGGKQYEVSTEKANIYFRVLSRFTIEQIQSACMKLLNTRSKTETFPSPAEIIEAIEGGSELKAIQALKKLEDAIDTYGYYYSMIFDDPVIMACVQRMGGWQWITTQQKDDWKWIRKDFCRLYSQLSQLHPAQVDAPQRLIGNCEQITEEFEEDNRLNHMVVDLSMQKQIEMQQKKKMIE